MAASWPATARNPKETALNIGAFFELLKPRRLQAFRRRRAAERTRPAQEPPLRPGLFSAEQTQRDGRAVAGQHRLSARPSLESALGALTEHRAVRAHTPRSGAAAGG